MSDDDLDPLDPLDPALAALFAEDRKHAQAASGARDRVRKRLSATLGGGDGGGSRGGEGDGTKTVAGTAGVRHLAPVLGALVVGGAIGAAATAGLSSPRVVYIDRVVEVRPTDVARAAEVPPPPVVEEDAAGLDRRSPPGRRVDGGERYLDDLDGERRVLDVARGALARGDVAATLTACERHAREHPRGQMSEEREALWVQALARAGRREDAVARGSAFRERYPRSVLTPVVESALLRDGGSSP